MYNPISTYRLQFHKDFKFRDAHAVIPYLNQLGIKTIYASPIGRAVKGSMHGYDVTNANQLNDELGNNEDFKELIASIKEHGMGWIQDIVPNHMAYSPQNPWIYDILLNGRNSKFFPYFDMKSNYHQSDLSEKIMLPFFGKPLHELIESNELSIAFEPTGFMLCYFENKYPVSVNAYPFLFNEVMNEVNTDLEDDLLTYNKTSTDWDKQISQLYDKYKNDKKTRSSIQKIVECVNSDPSKMTKMVEKLAYHPVFWRDTEKTINYRRFFTINSLICTKIEEKEVFAVYHEMVMNLIENDMINGLRVDHVDGLFNPGEYLDRLRKKAGDNIYLVVEKILEKEENIPDKWQIEGTTGYDFLGLINNLLTNGKNAVKFHAFYKKWSGEEVNFKDIFHNKKRYILYNRLKGELQNLHKECLTLPAISTVNISTSQLFEAIGEFLVFCPVYKVYNPPSEFTDEDINLVSGIFARAVKYNKELTGALKFLEDLFFLKGTTDKSEISLIDHFFRHCMQYTGPLMAKGLEDTTYYSYNPFIVHNEVGDSPSYFGISTHEFHKNMQIRAEKYPLTLNTTSTHDTKRGEDARARLNVVSNMPDEWIEATNSWREMNKSFKRSIEEKIAPTANDEYFIYQSLCAHAPIDGKYDQEFMERFNEYLIKALREAKVDSSWSNPDIDYEDATMYFIKKILFKDSLFLGSFKKFVQRIIPHGFINSIAQLLIKNMAPGIPDTYQGNASWNFDFVDPDNRRPVDYNELQISLKKMKDDYENDPEGMIKSLWQDAETGDIKQWMTHLTLQERRNNENLFLEGAYIPLEPKGKYADHVFAFARKKETHAIIIIVPLNTGAIPDNMGWENTWVDIQEIAHSTENLLTRKQLKNNQRLNISELFQDIPFGLLKSI